MRKICVITGSRAEYGLLYGLMKEVDAAADTELQVLVTGMHLSPEFGLTWKQIEADGFSITGKVDMQLSSDSPAKLVKSMAVGMVGFSDALTDLNPDIIVLLGDRFEIFSAASAAMMLKIPIAHIHGGEVTEGVIDESIRHSISKMSHLHFTATEEYRNRVIQMGEQPNSVFNVGAAGIDNIERLDLLNRKAFEESIDFKLISKNLIITFHPVTLEKETAGFQFSQLLDALDKLENTHLIFTQPNADSGGRVIIKMIEEYVVSHPDTSVSFTSMGPLRYLSALQHVDAVIGNSSSGLIEAPSFNIATVNIGDRQRGRIKAESVIDCQPRCDSIMAAIDKLYSKKFQEKLAQIENPYGHAGMAKKVFKILRSYCLSDILKKYFYDLNNKHQV